LGACGKREILFSVKKWRILYQNDIARKKRISWVIPNVGFEGTKGVLNAFRLIPNVGFEGTKGVLNAFRLVSETDELLSASNEVVQEEIFLQYRFLLVKF